jgi:hypothetical protein
MGDRDVIAIVDRPNAEAAAAVSFAGMATRRPCLNGPPQDEFMLQFLLCFAARCGA